MSFCCGVTLLDELTKLFGNLKDNLCNLYLPSFLYKLLSIMDINKWKESCLEY